MFVDRERELAHLETMWASDGAELVIVYGRRRVGKTELLRRFADGKPHAFWTATLTSEAMLRRSFTETLWRARQERSHGGERPAEPGTSGGRPGFVYDDWEAAIAAIAEIAAEQPFLVIIDEYPYLVDAVPGISSILQKLWDERLRHSRVTLVLCGSSIGMMERETLAYGAPLYGRRTGQIHLGPLPLAATAALVSRYDVSAAVETHAVFGGIPAYLRRLDDRRSLLDNIETLVLDPDGILHPEPEFLLREELREPRNYFGILQAIAGGRTRVNDIAQAVGLERPSISPYLATLRSLGLIERRVPITEKNPAKSRRGIYRVRDPFLRFWFRFVGPRRAMLEARALAATRREIEAQLPQFVGTAFEDMARDWLLRDVGDREIEDPIERIGSWWEADREVDVVAVRTRSLLIAECKWTSRPVGGNVLDELRKVAAPLVEAYPELEPVYILFSRSGFTPDLEAHTRHADTRLVTASTLVGRTADRSIARPADPGG